MCIYFLAGYFLLLLIYKRESQVCCWLSAALLKLGRLTVIYILGRLIWFQGLFQTFFKKYSKDFRSYLNLARKYWSPWTDIFGVLFYLGNGNYPAKRFCLNWCHPRGTSLVVKKKPWQIFLIYIFSNIWIRENEKWAKWCATRVLDGRNGCWPTVWIIAAQSILHSHILTVKILDFLWWCN